jgi:hypothetical protein
LNKLGLQSLLSPEMNTAWITAFSAIMGSLVGALTSVLTTYVSQRNQSRRDFLNKQFVQRETLYCDFINEAARLFADSLQHQFEKTESLVSIYAILNRIRLKSSQEVLRAAMTTIDDIIASYNRPNLTTEQLRGFTPEELQSRPNELDPLRKFGEACRKELNAIIRF